MSIPARDENKKDMSIYIREGIKNKVKEILEERTPISRLELLSKEKKEELINNYAYRKINIEENDKIKVIIDEYENGFKQLTIQGKVMDPGKNTEEYEERIILKDNIKVMGYSTSNTLISFLHIIQPKVAPTTPNSNLDGKDCLLRERSTIYLENDKRFFYEAFRVPKIKRVIWENFIDYKDGIENEKIELFYDVMQTAVYGEKNSIQENCEELINYSSQIVKEGLVLK